ncbi:DUF1990 family protein [Gordonia insulae]|nr:DUF1990 family protein [Gordonia insulae]
MGRRWRPLDGDTAARLRAAPFTYPEVGGTGGELPPGYHQLSQTVRLGAGGPCFDRARESVLTWRVQLGAGVGVSSSGPSVMATAGLSLLGAGRVAAEPQLPRVIQYSENIGTVGDHDFCRGSLNLGTVAPKGKRGVVRLTVTSFGFTGNGPGWKRDPNCRFRLNYAVISAAVGYRWISVPVSFRARPGQKFVREVYTGSGLVDLTVGTAPLHDGKGAPQSFASSIYTIVP